MQAVFDQGPFAPCPASFNMAAHVLAKAAQMPEKTALSVLHETGHQDWNYGQIEAAVRGMATGFAGLGLQAGDIVLLRLGNRPEVPLAYLAAIAADMLPVPTSAQLTEAETARIIDELSPTLILHEDGVPCPDHPNRIDAAALAEMQHLPAAAYSLGDPARPAYIVYTSGTSGKPRAVVHAHRAIWARGMMHQGWYGLTDTDRMLHAGAFNWTYTMGTGLMDPWTVGATALIPAARTRPEELPDLIARSGATIFAAAPGVYRKFLASTDKIYAPALRHGLSAGETLAAGTRAQWHQASGTPVFEAFGMSECSTFISASPDHPAAPGTMGRPQNGRRIAILGDDGAAVSVGCVGVIAVHRDDPGLMLGYRNAPAETSARFSGDWFVTGDLGRMDADGNITFEGRADDMMNAGGYRVSPLEVEAVLSRFPGIEQIAVTDVEVKPDLRVIMAFYTSAGGLDPAALDAHARSHLAGYKVPRAYHRRAELPVGPNGKLARKSLRQSWSPA